MGSIEMNSRIYGPDKFLSWQYIYCLTFVITFLASYFLIVQHNTYAIYNKIIDINYDRTWHNKITQYCIMGLYRVSTNVVDKVWCCRYMFIFFQHHHNRHPMAHPSGRYMERHLWVKDLINVLRHYRIITPDSPWLVRKGNRWGVPCEFKVGLMNCITTGSSQQTHQGLPTMAIHGLQDDKIIFECFD